MSIHASSGVQRPSDGHLPAPSLSGRVSPVAATDTPALPDPAAVARSRIVRMKARTHQGHMTEQNIDQLGEFIKALAPEPGAKWRDPGIVLSCLFGPVSDPGGSVHGSKLELLENPALIAESLLTGEYRTAGGELDQCGYSQYRRRGEQRERSGNHDVFGPLHKSLPPESAEGRWRAATGRWQVQSSRLQAVRRRRRGPG